MASGFAIALRSFGGPLSFPFRSPLNAESLFGLSILTLLFLVARSDAFLLEPNRQTVKQRDIAAFAGLFLIVACAFGAAAQISFLSDDFVHVRQSGEFIWNLGALMSTPGGDGFFRPLGQLFMAAIWPVAGIDPIRWHAAGFILHAINASLLFWLGRSVGFSRMSSWSTASLFAIFAANPEAVVWISASYDLLATLFVLLALALFRSSFGTTGWRVRVLLSASLISMILAILSKESAYACPLLMALLVGVRPGLIWRRKAVVLAPFFLTAGCLLGYRLLLFHGIGGYLDAAGQPQALAIRLLPVLKVLTMRLWAILFFPINWSLAPEPLLGFAIVLLVGSALLLSTSQVSRRALATAIGFVLIAALPPLQQLLIGSDMLKARYLYLPAAGFCLLFGAAIQFLPVWKGRTAYAGFVIFHCVALRHNLAGWKHAADRAQIVCKSAAACSESAGDRVVLSGVPHTLHGVYFFQNGLAECVRMQSGGAHAKVEIRDGALTDGERSSACAFSWDEDAEELQHSRNSEH